MRICKKWTSADIEFLKKHYADGDKEMLTKYFGRSWNAVNMKAFWLGLKRDCIWIVVDIEFLKKHYADGDKEMLTKYFGRSWKAIMCKAWELGLTKCQNHFIWTEEEDEYLKNNYFDEEKKILMKNLNHSWVAIKLRANSLGLKRDVFGERSCRWNGGSSFGSYCSKFNGELKEKIREKFNRQCFICGIIEEQNGKKLAVHHVNYNKDCGCDGSQCYLVPLCGSCHMRTNHNRWFWEKLLMACYEDPYMAEYYI